MAPQPDLVKIGMEGFAILDAYYGRKGRCPAPKGSQPYYNNITTTKTTTTTTKQPHGHEGTKVPLTKVTIVDYNAAKLYNGALIVEYHKRKPRYMA